MERWARNMRTVDDLTERFVGGSLATSRFRSGSFGSRPVLSRTGFGSHVAPGLRPALERAPWIRRRRTTEERAQSADSRAIA